MQVDIGFMQVDYGTLLTQRRVAMKNIPTGAVRIHLSSTDMGNFLAHPMFQQAAATAVQVWAWSDNCSCMLQRCGPEALSACRQCVVGGELWQRPSL